MDLLQKRCNISSIHRRDPAKCLVSSTFLASLSHGYVGLYEKGELAFNDYWAGPDVSAWHLIKLNSPVFGTGSKRRQAMATYADEKT